MNKTILITGASKGIGFALVNKFLENGFNVIGTSTSGKISGIENENFEVLQLNLSELKNIELIRILCQREKEQCGVCYTSPQSPIVTFLYVGLTTLGTSVNSDWLTLNLCALPQNAC